MPYGTQRGNPHGWYSIRGADSDDLFFKMFKLLSKLVNSVVGNVDTEDDEEEEDEPVLPPSGLPQSYETEKINFSGKVTHIHNGYGLIDHSVYFAFDVVIGGIRPYVGCLVHVTASRFNESSGWRADQVTIVSNQSWNNVSQEDRYKSSGQRGEYSDSPDLDKETLDNTNNATHESNDLSSGEINEDSLIGVITKITNSSGFINGNIPFDITDTVAGFVPYRGDWVTVKIYHDETLNRRWAEKVEPLRTLNFEGVVNSVRDGHGYINSEIFFTFNVCKNDRVPRHHDKVCGQAVETNQGSCVWRAVSVVCQDQGHSSNGAKLFTSPTQGHFLQELLRNKEGITITDRLHLGTLRMGEKTSLQVCIRNEGTSTKVYKGCVLRCHSDTQFSIQPPKQSANFPDESENICMQPGESVFLTILSHGRNLGNEKQLLVFNFENFKIGRHVSVDVSDRHEDLVNPSAPYQRRRGLGRLRSSQQAGGKASWVVPGERPASSRANIQLPNRLPQYPVPADLRECIFQKKDMVQRFPCLAESLTMENYTERLRVLLFLEEVQMEIDIREFDLERVCMRPIREFLALRVPGLAEGRPSVMIGDKIHVSVPGDDSAPTYEGFVHEVLCDEVLLKFHSDFHQHYVGEDYDVVFTFNRTPMRRNHQAIHFAPKLGREVIFPSSLITKMPQTFMRKRFSSLKSKEDIMKETVSPAKGQRSKVKQDELKFFNKILNRRQKAAVTRILNGESRPTPYILFGPPGTGKTVTLVEAILQVFHHLPDSRIIACAQSNSAADLLASRLQASGCVRKVDMVRLNAFQRIEENIPEDIKSFCQNGDDLETVSRYRVIVCTCSTAGTFYSLKLKPGHFTHIFIDEAGQAMEPECMVGVGLVAGQDGQVVLAGDPMQLGPVLRSKFAKLYGLGTSYLERLINTPLYARDPVKFSDHGCYDPLLVTKLVENYRSHPALISLPSRLFYHDELQVSADKAVIECLCQWPALPNQEGFPLLFHGIRPKDGDMREGNSPSWFNPVEAVQVMKYLNAVVNNDLCPLTYDDIGIITPYRKQVEKIRVLIDKLGMQDVKVGSVEEFQGQERLVMIISTVRSNESLVSSDVHHNLGFLSNPKRFNVAITRAQALLIIVGNPHVLTKDDNWTELLKYCVKNKAYVGCDLPESVTMHVHSEDQETAKIDTKKSSELIHTGAEHKTPQETIATNDSSSSLKGSKEKAEAPYSSRSENGLPKPALEVEISAGLQVSSVEHCSKTMEPNSTTNPNLPLSLVESFSETKILVSDVGSNCAVKPDASIVKSSHKNEQLLFCEKPNGASEISLTSAECIENEEQALSPVVTSITSSLSQESKGTSELSSNKSKTPTKQLYSPHQSNQTSKSPTSNKASKSPTAASNKSTKQKEASVRSKKGKKANSSNKVINKKSSPILVSKETTRQSVKGCNRVKHSTLTEKSDYQNLSSAMVDEPVGKPTLSSMRSHNVEMPAPYTEKSACNTTLCLSSKDSSNAVQSCESTPRISQINKHKNSGKSSPLGQDKKAHVYLQEKNQDDNPQQHISPEKDSQSLQKVFHSPVTNNDLKDLLCSFLSEKSSIERSPPVGSLSSDNLQVKVIGVSELPSVPEKEIPVCSNEQQDRSSQIIQLPTNGDIKGTQALTCDNVIDFNDRIANTTECATGDVIKYISEKREDKANSLTSSQEHMAPSNTHITSINSKIKGKTLKKCEKLESQTETLECISGKMAAIDNNGVQHTVHSRKEDTELQIPLIDPADCLSIQTKIETAGTDNPHSFDDQYCIEETSYNVTFDDQYQVNSNDNGTQCSKFLPIQSTAQYESKCARTGKAGTADGAVKPYTYHDPLTGVALNLSDEEFVYEERDSDVIVESSSEDD